MRVVRQQVHHLLTLAASEGEKGFAPSGVDSARHRIFAIRLVTAQPAHFRHHFGAAVWLRVRMDATAAPHPIEYLDAAAGVRVALDYKRRLFSALDVRAGQAVLDVGCGPGTDLGRLADAVSPGGSVVGVDNDPAMLAEARRRLADRPEVSIWSGDAHALPLADASVDRARIDRVLQHVADPAGVLAEALRVLRPGGLLAMAEPDWDTLAVAGEDVATSRAWARFVAAQVRHATVGRQLVRLAADAGLTIRTVKAVPVMFRDFAGAEQILGLRRTTARAVQAGVPIAPEWLERLEHEPFLAGFTLYLVVADNVGAGH
jgi:ubiquinone/menaquinone biosynthesis C-methylase UbiE